MNSDPGHYAKAIVGGAASGGGSIILAYLVAKLSDGLALTFWGAVPGDVQGALTAILLGALTSWSVYRTLNTQPADPAPIPVTETKP